MEAAYVNSMYTFQCAAQTSYFKLHNYTTERMLIAPVKYNSASVFRATFGSAYMRARVHNA